MCGYKSRFLNTEAVVPRPFQGFLTTLPGDCVPQVSTGSSLAQGDLLIGPWCEQKKFLRRGWQTCPFKKYGCSAYDFTEPDNALL